ncbi:MAG TPA: HEAT repeat domain-containing protein [Gemmatimonadales bacterium]|nr:HEAT repeat domain-containing protein [Gemmatimonadales bacterium]
MPSPELSGWLLTYLLHSTLLLVAAWIVAPRFRSHRVREMLWKTALFGGFVTATGQSLLRVSPLAGRMTVPTRAAAAVEGTQPNSALSDNKNTTKADADDAEVTTDGAESSATPNISASSANSAKSAFVPAVSRETMLVLSWAIGAAFLLALYLGRRIHFARRIAARRNVTDGPMSDMLDELCGAAGIARPIRLSASTRLPSPVALGASEIAIPEAALSDLDPGQQRSMLAHELAHLDRRDPSWLTAASIVEQVAFIQPLNRLARRRIQESAEYLCDEWAVRRTGSGVLLAKCLAKVAEWLETSPRSLPVSGMAENKSHLVARVHRLLDGAPFPKAPGRRTLVAASFAVLAITVLALPGVSLARRQAPAPSNTPEPRIAPAAPAKARGLFPVFASARAPRAGIPGSGPRAALAQVGWTRPGRSSDGRPELQSADTGRIVAALMSVLKDPDVEVRRAAIRSLTNFEDPSTAPALREALRDSDAEIREAAIEGLANLHDAASGDAIAALIKDANKDVRARAVEAITELELKTSPAGLLDALHDSDPDVRQHAAEAVAHFGDVRAVPALKLLLDDPNGDVRESAVEALGEIRNQEAIEALIVALKAKDPKVRQAAADALGKRG